MSHRPSLLFSNTLTVVLLIVTSNESRGFHELDVAIATTEANESNIRYGHVVYRVTRTAPIPGEDSTRSSSFEVVMQFDGRRSRWDYEDRRCCSDPDRTIVFDAKDLGTANQDPAFNYSAIIYEYGSGPYSAIPFHPRFLGHGLSEQQTELTVSDVLRKVKQEQGNSVNLEVHRNGPELHVSAEWPDMKARMEFVLDQRAAYAPISAKTFTLRPNREPSFEMQATYKPTAGGGYIAAHISTIRRAVRDGKQFERSRCITDLISEEWTDRPDPAVFSLEGLGLPIGARVWDIPFAAQNEMFRCCPCW